MNLNKVLKSQVPLKCQPMWLAGPGSFALIPPHFSAYLCMKLSSWTREHDSCWEQLGKTRKEWRIQALGIWTSSEGQGFSRKRTLTGPRTQVSGSKSCQLCRAARISHPGVTLQDLDFLCSSWGLQGRLYPFLLSLRSHYVPQTHRHLASGSQW